MSSHDPMSVDDGLDMTSTLVLQLQHGDPEAAQLLQRLYRDALVRFCWGYLGRMEEAEDAVQDICCKVLTARPVPDRFRSWIYKVARNHCLNLLRTRASRKDGDPLPNASLVQDTLTGQLTHLVKEEMQSQLAELVRTLSPEQGEALRLRYVEGLSRAEIGEVLEITESVVKSRIFEGLKKLREYSAHFHESG